eukprot:jgi/Bigna1/68591/fgenesh1_pg.6_\
MSLFRRGFASAARGGGGVVDRIIGRFEKGFVEKLTQKRLIGREAEYPVVWPDGNAADVRLLLKELHKKDLQDFTPMFEELPCRLLVTLSSPSFLPPLSPKTKGSEKQLAGLRSPDKKLEIVLEVGWGTVEVITGPFGDLNELKTAHEDVGSICCNSLLVYRLLLEAFVSLLGAAQYGMNLPFPP